MLRRLAGALALSIVLGGCKGDTGPMGPEGPAGPAGPAGAQGPPGASNRLMLTGAVPGDGIVVRALPAESGSLENLPVLACYLRPPDLAGWFVVSDGFNDDAPFCSLGLVQGVFSAVMFQAPPGWTYAFVVFW